MSHTSDRGLLALTHLKLPALSHNARLLLSITAVNSLALSAVGALLNPYLRNAGMSAAFVGVYFSVSAVTQGIAAFGGGFLADSWGRRRVWLLGKMLQILAYLWLASGITGPAILFAAVLAGLSQMSLGAVTALGADASEPSWRATYFAVVHTAQALMAAVAPIVGGLLADRFGASWAFLGVLPLLVLVAVMIGQLSEQPRQRSEQTLAAEEAQLGPGAGSGVRRKLGALSVGILRGPYPPTAIVLLIHMLLGGVSNGVIMIILPMLMRDRLGMGYAGISGLSTASALGMALTLIIGARLADRHGRRRVMLVAMTCGVVLACAFPLMTTALGYYALIFAFGLTANAANGAFSATAMESVREESRASYGGVMQGLSAGGMALGNLVGGFSYGANPILSMYLVIGLFAISTTLLYLFLQETGVNGRSARQLTADGGGLTAVPGEDS